MEKLISFFFFIFIYFFFFYKTKKKIIGEKYFVIFLCPEKKNLRSECGGAVYSEKTTDKPQLLNGGGTIKVVCIGGGRVTVRIFFIRKDNYDFNIFKT